MPVRRAQYIALLARAVPSLTLHQIEWEVPIGKGWALIHAGCILAGEPMVWSDHRLSQKGRWWNRVMRHFKRAKKH